MSNTAIHPTGGPDAHGGDRKRDAVPRPRFGSVHHISFAVASLDRSLDFYLGVLGCRQLPRPEMGFRGAWLQTGDQQIHLMECPSDMTTKTAETEATPDARNNHIAISVDDLIAAREYLSAQGVPFSPGPGPLDQVFLSDPDGNTLELTAAAVVKVEGD